jgi:hypothetical protein
MEWISLNYFDFRPVNFHSCERSGTGGLPAPAGYGLTFPMGSEPESRNIYTSITSGEGILWLLIWKH